MLARLFALIAPAPVAIDARTRRLIERAAEHERQRQAYADRRVREIRQARAKFQQASGWVGPHPVEDKARPVQQPKET